MSSKRGLWTGVFLLTAISAFAQDEGATGTVEGSVSLLEGGTAPGVIVRVRGTNLQTVTDVNGRFEIGGVPAGRQSLELEAPWGATAVRPIEVEPGLRRAVADIKLAGENTIRVEGGPLEISKDVLLSTERFARAGLSDVSTIDDTSTADTAGDAAKKVVGVTTADSGKKIYVRGLGDRYSSMLVNRSPMPSTEPDRREVPMDLFPTGLIDAIVVYKSYSPDLPGEFSGGVVALRTKSIPEEDFLTISLGTSYVDGTTFRDFSTYQGGNLDLLGFDDGTRALPDGVPREAVRAGAAGRGLTAAEVQEVGRLFPNVWNEEVVTAPPNLGLGLTFGKVVSAGDSTDDSWPKLGIIGSLEWENDYRTIRDATFRLLKNQGTLEAPDPIIFNSFEIDSYEHSVAISSLVNLVLEISQAQKIGVRGLWSHQAEDLFRFQKGFEAQIGAPVEVSTLRYIEKNLYQSELFGEHLLDGGPLGELFFEWRGGYALSQRDSPDDRSLVYELNPTFNEFQWREAGGSASRDFYLLDENLYNGAADLSIPFAPLVDEEKERDELEPPQKIKFGVSYVRRDRDFDARKFRFQAVGTPLADEGGEPILLTSSPEDLFRARNIHPGGFAITETTRPTDNYNAEWEILAGYGLVDFKLIEPLRLMAGARIESSEQAVDTFELFGAPGTDNSVTAVLDNLDVLPAGSLTWEIWKGEKRDTGFEPRTMLRLAASQTVTRPEFRELAAFEFTDVAGGFTAVGNPELEETDILNLDLRWDWVPDPGDVISASFFYKDFSNPIEQVILPTGSQPITTWRNAESAELYGVEFEIQKDLGFIDRWIDSSDSARPFFGYFSIVANAAWLDSQVDLDPQSALQLTSKSRPLQGQPEYILNLGLEFEGPPGPATGKAPEWWHGLSIGIFANTFGDRITAVGAFGVPDEVEQPRWSLDVGIAKKIGRGVLKLTGKNLLDDEFEFKQGKITNRAYERGLSIGLSWSYSF